jgi:hypothetical protein
MFFRAIGLTYWLKIMATEIVKLKRLKPFARIGYGRISTVYDTIRGVNAILPSFISQMACTSDAIVTHS